MLLGALLDAGLDLKDLQADLAKLGIAGYELTLTRQVRHGISGSQFKVLELNKERPGHNLQAVEQILQQSTLSPEVMAMSLRVFRRLAEAEAMVHGIPIEEVHFHELGAIDTIVDIVGFCCAVERLSLVALYASPLPLGSGQVETEHGLLPVPAPATLALLAAAKAPIVPSEARTELVTPTGAAILSTLASFRQPSMSIEKVGYGFGAKELPWANALRVWIGEPLPVAGKADPEGPGHAHALGCHHQHEHAHKPNLAS